MHWMALKFHRKKNEAGEAVTTIRSPEDWNLTPDIRPGIGYSWQAEGNQILFHATEPSAPIYFMTEDGIRTEMYLYGNYVRTLLTVPVAAAEGNYERVLPSVVFYENRRDH